MLPPIELRAKAALEQALFVMRQALPASVLSALWSCAMAAMMGLATVLHFSFSWHQLRPCERATVLHFLLAPVEQKR